MIRQGEFRNISIWVRLDAVTQAKNGKIIQPDGNAIIRAMQEIHIFMPAIHTLKRESAPPSRDSGAMALNRLPLYATIREESRETPVAFEADVCVIGGSCTGVFAALRVARQGLNVALVEKNTVLGGMATAALVNEWHSLRDIFGGARIIGGLTVEMLDRLRHRNAVRETSSPTGERYRFNSAELALELDECLRLEHNRIRTFLEARCVGAVKDRGRVIAALIEDKSGRRAIRADMFIDASGDGDLLRRAGFSARRNECLQPVSLQQLVSGLGSEKGLWERVKPLASEFSYPLENATPWFCEYPNPADVQNIFGARMNGIDASDADQLTAALFEGRRRQRALLDMLRQTVAPEISCVSLAHALGIRETWHASCQHRLLASELLSGVEFPDAIACGTYPVDIHSPEGTLLRYLDGRETLIGLNGETTHQKWRVDKISSPPYYQIPLRSLIPFDCSNLLVAGRLLDADPGAFGAARVMVNTNQTGEAAGIAAALAVLQSTPPCELSPEEVRRALLNGGSLIPPLTSSEQRPVRNQAEPAQY